MRTTFAFLVLSAILFHSCGSGNFSEDELHGTWQATMLVQDGDTMQYDLSRVNFVFGDDRKYRYQSNLAAREAGYYRLRGANLFTTDTLKSDQKEKAVILQSMSPDSLILTMKAATGMQKLFIKRK